MTKCDNGTCVRPQSECSASCRCHGLEEQHPPPPGFPAVSSSLWEPVQHAPEAGWAAAKRRWSSRRTCRSLVQHGPGKQQQQQQQQSPVLYSPTSALQNACCGCTGAQLHASASSSARHRTSSASVQRMPLTENGIFLNTDAMFFLPLRCCADALQCRSSGGQQRPPPPLFSSSFYFNRQRPGDVSSTRRSARSAPVQRWGFTVCTAAPGGVWTAVCLSGLFSFLGSRRFYKAARGAPPPSRRDRQRALRPPSDTCCTSQCNWVHWLCAVLSTNTPLYLGFSISCNFILPAHHTSEVNIALFTALHLSDSLGY